MSACSKGAIFKEERYGAVLVDADLCDGCRSCWDACPYGAVSFRETDAGLKMSKCTMCIDRLQNEQKPACVTSCPMRALDFGEMAALREKYGDLSQLGAMPDASITTPAVVFKPADERKQLIPFDAERALELLGSREGLKPLYEDSSELTEVFEGLVGRDHLDMKPTTDEGLMYLTKNDEG